MNRSLIALATAPDLFQTAHAHDRWDNGKQIPAWVKGVCCGPNDVHHLRPEQVRRNAAGDYVVDIYPFPVPARPSLAKTATTGCSSTRTTASMAGSGASSRRQCSRPERMAWTVSWSTHRRRVGWVDAETNAGWAGLATADRSTIEPGRTASVRATAGSGRPSGVCAAD
jgi:hypothetical protein